MKITKQELKQIIQEEMSILQEGSLDDLQKGQKMIQAGQAILMNKIKELKLDVDLKLLGDYNQARNAWLDAIFKANYDRTGGQLD